MIELLKDKCQSIYATIELINLKGKKFGINGTNILNYYINKCKKNLKEKKKNILNADYLIRFFQISLKLVKNGILPVFVFKYENEKKKKYLIKNHKTF